MNRNAAERIAAGSAWLAGQPTAFGRAVIEQARLVSFSAGSTIFDPDDPPGGIYGLVAGAVLVTVVPPHGGPLPAHLLRPPVWFGEGPALQRGPRWLGFHAQEACFALHVPLVALAALTEGDTAATRSLAAISQGSMRIAARVIADLLIRPPERRIAAVLARVAAPEGTAFRLTQGELGELANASREQVNRALARFAAAGWLTAGYRQVTLREAGALADFAGDEAAAPPIRPGRRRARATPT